MIDKTIVEPLRLAADAFEAEAQPFGNRAAAAVFDGATNAHPVQAQSVKPVSYNCPASIPARMPGAASLSRAS